MFGNAQVDERLLPDWAVEAKKRRALHTQVSKWLILLESSTHTDHLHLGTILKDSFEIRTIEQFLWRTGVSNFWPKKYLKEFDITCLICFADEFLVQSQTSNLDRNCAFEQFESGPKLQFGMWFWSINDHESKCSFGPLSKGSNTWYWKMGHFFENRPFETVKVNITIN